VYRVDRAACSHCPSPLIGAHSRAATISWLRRTELVVTVQRAAVAATATATATATAAAAANAANFFPRSLISLLLLLPT
jgi:hypothetical protein